MFVFVVISRSVAISGYKEIAKIATDRDNNHTGSKKTQVNKVKRIFLKIHASIYYLNSHTNPFYDCHFEN